MNWKIVLIILLAAIGIMELLVYYKVEPITGWAKTAASMVTPIFTQANGVYETMKANPLLAPLITAGVAGLVGLIYKKATTNKINQIQSDNNESQLAYQTRLNEISDRYQTALSTNTKLQSQVDALKVSQQDYSGQESYIDTLEGQLQTAITQRNMLDSQLSRILNDPLYLAYKQSQLQTVVP